MPDFSVYTALSAQPDIAAKRTYDANNLKYAQGLAAFAEQQTQQKAAALQGIGDYFSQVDQQINELLPEDMARVKAVWDKNKGEVITKLSEYGNDPDMFMKLGGATTVKKFMNDLYRSPEMQNGINTKNNLTAYLKDAANPKLEHRAVSWTNANGETVNGDLATWTKAYKSGEAVDLKYNGAYDKPNIDPLEFAKIPNDGKPVTADQLFDYMVMKGTAPADAADYLKKAAPHVLDAKNPNNTVFKWGDNKENALGWARLNWEKQNKVTPTPVTFPAVNSKKLLDPSSDIWTGGMVVNSYSKDGKTVTGTKKIKSTSAFGDILVPVTQVIDGKPTVVNVPMKKFVMVDGKLYGMRSDKMHGQDKIAIKDLVPINDVKNQVLVPYVNQQFGSSPNEAGLLQEQLDLFDKGSSGDSSQSTYKLTNGYSYSAEELKAAGYTDEDIKALKQ